MKPECCKQENPFIEPFIINLSANTQPLLHGGNRCVTITDLCAEKTQPGGTLQFAVACKLADKHTITFPKRAYIRLPSGAAGPGVLRG